MLEFHCVSVWCKSSSTHLRMWVLMLTRRAACVSGRPGKSPAYSWLCAAAHVSPLLCFDRPHDRMCSAKRKKKRWLQHSRLHSGPAIRLKIARGVQLEAERESAECTFLHTINTYFCDCACVCVCVFVSLHVIVGFVPVRVAMCSWAGWLWLEDGKSLTLQFWSRSWFISGSVWPRRAI